MYYHLVKTQQESVQNHKGNDEFSLIVWKSSYNKWDCKVFLSSSPKIVFECYKHLETSA